MTIASIIAALIGGATGITYGVVKRNQKDAAQYTYDEFTNAIKGTSLENVPIEDLFAELKSQNKITNDEYDRILGDIKYIHKQLGDKGVDPIYGLTHGKKYHKQAENLYKTLLDNLPELQFAQVVTTEKLPSDLKDLFKVSIPDIQKPNYIADIPAPTLGTAEPARLWTGQELADLHNINYDVNHYYDLIKQSADAAVDYAGYENALNNNATMVNDTKGVVSYLDSIRNARADAIANGATYGAKLANELLATNEAFGQYTVNQADTAAQATKNMQQPLSESAQSRLTARSYFDQLANSLSQDILQLYNNDSSRYAQDLLSNAAQYAADQNLRSNIANANANMEQAYVQAQANVNAERGRQNQQANDYAFLLENVFLPKRNNNLDAALYDFFNYVSKQQTGYKRYEGMLNNNTN